MRVLLLIVILMTSITKLNSKDNKESFIEFLEDIIISDKILLERTKLPLKMIECLDTEGCDTIIITKLHELKLHIDFIDTNNN